MKLHRASLAKARTVLAAVLALAASTALWAQRELCNTQCAPKGMWSDEITVKLEKRIANTGSTDMQETIKALSNASGMPLRHLWTLYRVGGPDFDGAFARLEPDNKRVIYYGAGFDDRFTRGEGPDLWYARVVLSHEMAHHLLQHTFADDLRVTDELEADRFAGCYMAALKRLKKSSASEQEVLKIYEQSAPFKASGSHPGRAARIAIVKEGWAHGSAEPAGEDRTTSACFKMKRLP